MGKSVIYDVVFRSYFPVASWFKMAAAVESTNQRYYCHRCEQNISPTIPVRTYLMSSHLYRSIGHSSFSKVMRILSFSTSFLCQFIMIQQVREQAYSFTVCSNLDLSVSGGSRNYLVVFTFSYFLKTFLLTVYVNSIFTILLTVKN